MKYSDYVNTKQGSASRFRFSNGNTLPLVQLPFGMAAFAPQTSEGNVSWYYHPEDRSLEGIRLTHQPSPWIADYGPMCFMLQKGSPALGGAERWSGIRPEDAVLKPYYLKYNVLRSRSVLEFTPTVRGAKIRVGFADGGDNYFTVHSVTGSCDFGFDKEKNTLFCSTDGCSGGEHEGFREYIVIAFPEGSVDFDKVKVGSKENGGNSAFGSKVTGEEIAIYVPLKTPCAELSLATSYISYENALLSLEREALGRSFDEIMSDGEKIWEEYLSRVIIETDDSEKMKTFYSCMYRAFLYPHRCSEINARGEEEHYCPHDGKVYPGVRFTDNGFWDTYRTVYPFFSLAARDEMKLMLKSYINDYRECGWLPRWTSVGERGCMPSTLLDAVICDAAVKGLIEKDDLETALEGMLKHATTDAPFDYFGRNGAESYCRLGYVPYDEQKESVNLTLDAAYGDWCIARIAGLLGKTDIESEYDARAKNYANLFDKDFGLMRARNSAGDFRPDFTPIGWGRDYTEGSAWQNSFAVPHDMEGLADLYGGKEMLLKKIDELFETKPDYEVVGYSAEIHEITEMAAADFGQCAISNQPSFHIPYIYSELGETEKTAYWVKKLCDEAFSYKDDGFPGDEDNGTMALWYVFSVLGFYPFCPGRPDFVKGVKQADKAYILGKEVDIDKFEGNKIPYSELI